ncbi:peptidylglycine alpha-hydroxylating monooxygenase [Eurytemora carolleeae]|uniref:peptidylglycine alpha-hydroxylating monooxygenase n=1 Tax=Eurytemora carolleeae TaxID=1294199 RepID=UPI000C76DAC8|nr:peptidylglycine alpha-hydroxylating monooxygenase [Eurytemora carolleeae]|eukprot:XP_023322359.1 peptidylglycine alpha-hydroxylating monooxygenase-like [Eurytemora affinis]
MHCTPWLVAFGCILAIQAKKESLVTEEFPLLMPNAKPDLPETYFCTPIRLDTDLTYYIVGFRPNATKMTAHHMLVYGCEEPGSKDPLWNCGEMAVKQPGLKTHKPCGSGDQIVYAWGMDAPSLELPAGVGFRVGADSSIKYLVLQVHYASIDEIPEKGDDSGVFLQYTEEQQPKSAGVLLLGTGGFAPAHSTTYFETSCEIEDTREIHPFAFRTHTHGLGKVVSGWRVRDKNNWKLIGKKDPMLPQMFYPIETEMTVRKGDTIAARCTMVNNRDRTVYIGTTNEDEMCNFYMMYWVEGKQPVTPNTCFTRGPPTWSWGGWFGGGLSNIPDLEASTL